MAGLIVLVWGALCVAFQAGKHGSALVVAYAYPPAVLPCAAPLPPPEPIVVLQRCKPVGFPGFCW